MVVGVCGVFLHGILYVCTRCVVRLVCGYICVYMNMLVFGHMGISGWVSGYRYV